jgi:DNA-directed RNA polymerase specialized sigma24 family protein
MAHFVQIKEAVANQIALESPDCAPLCERARCGQYTGFGFPEHTRYELGKGHMNRKGGQVGGDLRTTRPERDQNNAAALQRVLDNNAEELIWVAEVMAGSRPAGEQCLAEAIELADAAQYVGREWMHSRVKRLLVHVALNRISSEIRELLPASRTRSAVALTRAGVSVRDRQKLRSISPQRIGASLDVLERACFILHVYLAYPLLDSALLLGCPRGWIESICERVLTNIVAVGQPTEDGYRYVDSIGSPGVAECAG